MDEDQGRYFDALTIDRKKIADVLDAPSVRGFKKGVIDKYSDQAHFIYELLQNADDVAASDVRFSLRERELLFFHNGKRHFSVSDPANEESDSADGKLGDINAITSVANSTKKSDSNSIGKFGVGFKAVFQYTETPMIYDDEFAFRIERFIVPIALQLEHPERKPGETVFVFPFNHPEIPVKEAVDDIEEKLRTLVYPALFLKHVQSVEYETTDSKGGYYKEILAEKEFSNTRAQKLKMTYLHDGIKEEDILWVFTRSDFSDRYRISVGFYIKDEKLKPVSMPAFCFFPTKTDTGLNFIVQAPFLLTDSREGIRAGQQHNLSMIDDLAQLAAESLLYLRDIGKADNVAYIDDKLFSIIPYDSAKFTPVGNRNKLSFMPFYTEMHYSLKTKDILPTSDGDFVSYHDAFWAESTRLPKIFSNEILRMLTGNQHVSWVFASIGAASLQEGHGNTTLRDYLQSIVSKIFSDETLLALINVSFIEAQSIEWLKRLYKYLNETEARKARVRTQPIFLNQDRKAVAAFDSSGKAQLFLPSDDDDEGYQILHPELLHDQEIRSFAKSIGVHEPELQDEISTRILPRLKTSEDFDCRSYFRKIVRYYNTLGWRDAGTFVHELSDLRIFPLQDKIGRECGNRIYSPDKELQEYLSGIDDIIVVPKNYYGNIVGMDLRAKALPSFLRLFDLGTSLPKIREVVISQEIAVAWHLPAIELLDDDKYEDFIWREERIDGCEESLASIIEMKDKQRSLLLWKMLAKLLENGRIPTQKKFSMCGRVSYRLVAKPCGKGKTKAFESSQVVRLKEQKWLFDKSGKIVSAKEAYIQTLDAGYGAGTEQVRKLIDFLGIEEEPEANLSDEQRRKIKLAGRLEQAGFTEADVEELIRQREAKASRQKERETPKSSAEGATDRGVDLGITGSDRDTAEAIETSSSEDRWQDIAEPAARVARDIAERASRKTGGQVREKGTEDVVAAGDSCPAGSHSQHSFSESAASNGSGDETVPDFDEWDQDEYTPPVVDYDERIEQAKQKSADEINRITYEEELQGKAQAAERYSYAWFQTLLQMEALGSGEHDSGNRAVSIHFGRVEWEPGTSRTLLLKHPDRYIPSFVEELADIPMVLTMADQQTKKVIIEAASINSYTLKVKLKSGSEMDGIDVPAICDAHIEAQSPGFLLDALIEGFDALDLSPEFNMQSNLCANIEFIFGPPGTGKTTYLSREVLLPFMQQTAGLRVLVLTPTNKAADVIAQRIMSVMGDDRSYEDWLIRFGNTQSEAIEESKIYRDKATDILKIKRNVVVTTIARFPYDYFMVDGKRLYLKNLKWDYIVIDEASMIPLAQIVYPLYKKSPERFIIAGDPFQIEPIAAVDIWKDENIYTLVHLNDFKETETVPHEYPVKRLMTQYRSVPAIGRLFSEFAYQGALQHYRTPGSQRRLNLEGRLDIKALNLIKFPVSRYEGIYRSKRLQGRTPYHIYSALFTYEFVCYLAKIIAEANPGEHFRIGIIAPYRAQADLVDKILAQAELPALVEVIASTIHGFQGDECDIVMALFNTPPGISSSKRMFLNKRNIINVAISRAQDYLFVIMPDRQTRNIQNLMLVNRVESLMKEDDYQEFESHEIERLMFGSRTYLEDNSFTTSHQSVNVYGLPEKYYEIRSEDEAVDIQIHKVAPKLRTVSGTPVATVENRDLYSRKPAADGWSEWELASIAEMMLEFNAGDISDITAGTAQLTDRMAAARTDGGHTLEEVGEKLLIFRMLSSGFSAQDAGALEAEVRIFEASKENMELFKEKLFRS